MSDQKSEDPPLTARIDPESLEVIDEVIGELLRHAEGGVPLPPERAREIAVDVIAYLANTVPGFMEAFQKMHPDGKGEADEAT